MLLSKDFIIDKDEKVVHRAEICVFRQQAPNLEDGSFFQENWLDRVSGETESLNYEIFTDGAFEPRAGIMETLLDHNVVNIAEAAVVLVGNTESWRDENIVAVRIMNDERIKVDSAFPMELLARVAALRIRGKHQDAQKF